MAAGYTILLLPCRVTVEVESGGVPDVLVCLLRDKKKSLFLQVQRCLAAPSAPIFFAKNTATIQFLAPRAPGGTLAGAPPP